MRHNVLLYNIDVGQKVTMIDVFHTGGNVMEKWTAKMAMMRGISVQKENVLKANFNVKTEIVR